MDFLIEENNLTAHYFYRSGEGLCRSYARGSSWQERECILRSAEGYFGLYTDGQKVHIVAPTADGELIYLTVSGSERRRFILKKLGDDRNILKLHIYPIRGRLNMLYTVALGGEILLMHCILGNNAMPHTVSRVRTPEFFVYANRVYYAVPDGSAGFSELADEKPELYIRTASNCSVPYLCDGHIAYESGGKIYFDSRELCSDAEAQGVIITEYDGRFFVAWQSGDFVKYIPADSTAGNAHCIINPSRRAQLYAIWRAGACDYFYGSHSDSELVTYINPAPFGSHASPATDHLRRRLEEMKIEIAELKKQLAEYNCRRA